MIWSSLLKFFGKMSTETPVVLGPVGVRGMKVLEPDKLLRKVEVPVLKVKGEENLAQISKICKTYFLKLENFKPVQKEPSDESMKCYYFNPEKITQWNDIAETDRLGLAEYGVTNKNFQFKEVELGYKNWNSDIIFKAVLPENEDIVSSFSQIGHIIHLNLREHLLDYRPLIGQVLLDKVKTCRTVVNKSNVIDNTYRNFSMEVIAGEEDYIVSVKENNCKFKFDFSKVYWNPRLGREHERILNLIKPNDVLFDVFCGVGPFAIPVAKCKKCKVFANDLNPESFKWLKHNAESNKINKSLFTPYNLDGKDFICDVFKKFITDYCKGTVKMDSKSTIHVTMNLPALAVEFLKHFKGLLKDHQEFVDNFDCEIIVYVYCFAVGDSKSVAKDMVSENFGCDMSLYIIDVFSVRRVAPKKEMLRVTLKLTKEILFDVTDENIEPPAKKPCLENC